MTAVLDPATTLAAMARPFVPPRLWREAVQTLNLLAGRAPLRLDAESVTLAVNFGPAAEPPGAGAMCLAWRFGDEAASVLLPPAAVAAVLAGVAPGVAADADRELACLLLELALAGPLEAIEAATGRTVSLCALADADEDTPDPVPRGAEIGVALQVGPAQTASGRVTGVLRLGPAALAALAELAGRLPRAGSDLSGVPIVLACRAGVSEVPASALAALSPGDAVVMQDAPFAEGRVAVIAGESRLAWARLAGGAARLDAAPRPVGAGLRRWCMGENDAPPGAVKMGTVSMGAADVGPVDAAPGDLQVTLVFELGRRAATLAELASLGAGSVVELGRDPADPTPVDVLANGQRIGRGEIVQVGGALAVRLLRVAHRGADDRKGASRGTEDAA